MAAMLTETKWRGICGKRSGSWCAPKSKKSIFRITYGINTYIVCLFWRKAAIWALQGNRRSNRKNGKSSAMYRWDATENRLFSTPLPLFSFSLPRFLSLYSFSSVLPLFCVLSQSLSLSLSALLLFVKNIRIESIKWASKSQGWVPRRTYNQWRLDTYYAISTDSRLPPLPQSDALHQRASSNRDLFRQSIVRAR